MKRSLALYRSKLPAHSRAHKPRSMQVAKANRLQAFFKSLIITSGLLIAGILVIIGLASLVVSQLEPLSTAQSLLLISTEKEGRTPLLTYLFLSPAQRELRVVHLPPSMPIKIMGGYGSYHLDAVFPLLKLESKSDQYIQASFSQALQRSLDGVMVLSYDTQPTSLAQIEEAWLWNLKRYDRGTLSLKETLRVMAFLRQLQPGDVKVVTVKTPEEWQTQLSLLARSESNEACPVSVINATTTKGIATKLTAILEKSSISVIKSADTPQLVDKTQLIIDENSNCERTLERIQQILPELITSQTDSALVNQYRSKIVVMVGKDVAEAMKE